WLAAMLLAMAIGLRSKEWEIAAAWGLGACAALVVTAVRTPGLGLAKPREVRAWFRHEALNLGIWRTSSGGFFSVADYIRVAGVSALLGPSAVGGYRAIESAYAPTSLIGPALTNPGLPTIRDALERRSAEAWALAVKLSLVAAGLVVAYVAALALG